MAEGELQQPQQPQDNNSELKQIRTFQGDVAEALQKQRESLVSIQRMESAKRGGAPAHNERRSPQVVFFLGGILLLSVAGLGGWISYNEFVRKTAPPPVVIPAGRFVPVADSVELPIKGLSRANIITRINGRSVETISNEITHLVLDTTTEEFLSFLETRAPGSLVRSLEPEFMLGNLGRSRFIIFKPTSFENTFAGMLKWETDLAEDLGPIFTTAPHIQNIGQEAVFRDVVYKNKDARVLYAPTATSSTSTSSTIPALLYSFLGNQMLIITEDLETLETLVERLIREGTTR